MDKREKNAKKRKKLLIYLILGGFLLEFLKILFKNKDRIQKFAKEEKREIKELGTRKEGFDKFCHDSKNLFKHYFIPHEGNDHKPKFLRPKSLAMVVVLLLLLKITVVGSLFLTYPEGARMSEIIISRVLELINIDRSDENINTLQMNQALSSSAFDKASDMVSKNYFAHYTPDGKKPWDFINREQYKYIYVGENLAMNFTTADSAHRALMASPTHKKNIMNERYSDIGLAMLSGMINGKQTNLLVQFFGATAESRLAAATVEPVVKAPVPAPIMPVTVAGEEKSEPKPTPVAEKPAPVLPPAEIPEPIKEDKIVKKETSEVLSSQVEERSVPALTEIPVPEAPIAEPKLALEFSPNINDAFTVVRVENTEAANLTSISRVLKTVNYIFAIMMIVMIIALAINIFIRLEVQHKPVIIQTLLVILFVTSLWYFKLHYLEAGVTDILLLSL